MVSIRTFGLAILPYFTSAYLVDPPTTASPDTIEDCTYWQVASENDTCASIIAEWGPIIPFTDAEFYTYNPSLAGSCDIVIGNSYCIEQNFDIPVTTTTSVASTSTSQAPTPTPTTLLGICESQAGGYKEYCPRCLSRCASETTYVADCFYNTFWTINGYDSDCWKHSGIDCANKAVDLVCPRV